jgi:hypothetical protein
MACSVLADSINRLGNAAAFVNQLPVVSFSFQFSVACSQLPVISCHLPDGRSAKLRQERNVYGERVGLISKLRQERDVNIAPLRRARLFYLP